MGYGYTCDDCGSTHADGDPAFMGRIHERWFKTSDLGGAIAEEYQLTPEDTITLCPDCLLVLLDD